MDWIDESYVGFDLETSGTKPEYALQPWRVASGDAWVTSMVSLRREAGKTIEGGELMPTVTTMRAMLEDAVANNRTIVGWNVAFDIAWLIAYGLEELVYKAKWLDGMLLWRHLAVEPEYDIMSAHKKKSFGLKLFVSEFLPAHAGYEEAIDFHDPDAETRAKLHAYNRQDVRFTLIGAKFFWQQLGARQRTAALIEAKSLPMIAHANLRGLPVDTLVSHELEAKLRQDAANELEKLQWVGVTREIVRSPLKLAALIFDDWRLPVGQGNPKTPRSTDKVTLHELAFIDPRAKSLRKYREAMNNETKFATGVLNAVRYNNDGYVRPQARPFGTYSGRLTYSSNQLARGQGKRAGTEKEVKLPTGFALHQMKNDPLFRAQIVPPPGYGLMEFDAAGQEFRWMAIASGDATMLQLCLPGEDAHSYMGARIGHVDYHELMRLKEVDKVMKGYRKVGKVGNLSLQYRTSAAKLRVVARVQYDIPMEMSEAQSIHFIYQKTYTGVPVYWNKQIAQTRRLGYVETFAGRRVQVVGSWDGRMGWSMGSTSINYRIQGTGADQKYLAMAVIKNYLTSIGAYFAWDLHDGIYLFVPLSMMSKAAVDIKYLLDNLPYKKAWGFDPPIPLPWDCKTGGSWGALKEYHP